MSEKTGFLLAKRALKWPIHFSNTAAIDVESVRSRLIIRKLSFLQRQLSHNAVVVGAKTMKYLVDDVDSNQGMSGFGDLVH